MNIQWVRDWFQVLMRNEFNNGYIAGLTVALLLILLFLVLRMILAFRFRMRGAKAILVPSESGEIRIGSDVLVSAVEAVAARFPAFRLHELRVLQVSGGKRYILNVVCGFNATVGEAFPDQAAKFKSAIFDAMQSMFGIQNLRRINLELDEFKPLVEDPSPTESDEKLTPDGKMKFPTGRFQRSGSDVLPPTGGF